MKLAQAESIIEDVINEYEELQDFPKSTYKKHRQHKVLSAWNTILKIIREEGDCCCGKKGKK